LHGELDGLALLGIESAQEDLVGMARAPFVGDEDAGRQLQDVGGFWLAMSASCPTSIWKSLPPRAALRGAPRTVTSSGAADGSGAAGCIGAMASLGTTAGANTGGGAPPSWIDGWAGRGAASLAGRAAAGGGSNTKGMRMRAANGWPFLIAGVRRQRRTASSAARSKSGPPLSSTSTCSTAPFSPTRTRRVTREAS
jgi:hypothetical protein